MASADTSVHQALQNRPYKRALLFFAFALAVMADAVSAVAYSIEAALRSLGGHLGLLLPTMGLVIGILGLIILNYWQLIKVFPEGGGSPEASGKVFGEHWSFLPIGALIVDFALTIAISAAAASSALIAYAPAIAPARIPLAVGLMLSIALITWFGHSGRVVFAIMTSLFIVGSTLVLVLGWSAHQPDPHHVLITHSAGPAFIAVIFAFPVAMALATGAEAPITSISQLGQLNNRGRRRFGRGTLVLTVIIVGFLTLGLSAIAVKLNIGIPQKNETQIADLAKAVLGNGSFYAFFQLSSGLVLLAAANSGFLAGPGLLRALARSSERTDEPLVPRILGITNKHHTPITAVIVYAIIAAAIIIAAGGNEQNLVLVYAAAIFVSFFAGLLAMARYCYRRRAWLLTFINVLGALAAAFTLAVNLGRGYPLISLSGTILIAAFLYWRWYRTGRPEGIETVEREAEADV